MILYLTSSPCVIGADRALLTEENHFLEQLRLDVLPSANCLYIASSPDAPDLNAHYSAEIAAAFAEAGLPFGELRILQSSNADQAARLVQWSNVIILAGGHVPTQNAFFRQLHLRELLRDYSGTIMGISAGTMNCAAMVYAQPEEPGESVDPAYQRFLPGLGLTYLNILPHYQQVKDDILDGKRLYEDVTFADSFEHSFLVLPDGSYVRACAGSSELFGEAYLLENAVMRKICGNHERIIL